MSKRRRAKLSCVKHVEDGASATERVVRSFTTARLRGGGAVL